MNLLDLVILLLCLGLGMLGLVRGLVRQASVWVGIVLGHMAGIRYFGPARRFLGLSFSHADVVAYMALFAAVYIAVRILGLLAERWVRASKLSGTDRAAGMLSGTLAGALLSILLVFLLVILLPRDAGVLRQSRLAPKALVAARWLQEAFPPGIAESFREKLRASAGSPGPGDEDPSGSRPAQPKKPPRK